MRLLSAAPVRVLPGLPIFDLVGLEGTLSPLLVEWLSCVVLLLTLSLCLPCVVWRSRRCGCGSSRWQFSLVRSRCDRWWSTDRLRFLSVRFSGFGAAGGSFLTARGPSENALA